MLDFLETKPFGAVCVGVVALATLCQFSDWRVVVFPVVLMTVYYLLIDDGEAPLAKLKTGHSTIQDRPPVLKSASTVRVPAPFDVSGPGSHSQVPRVADLQPIHRNDSDFLIPAKLSSSVN